MKNRYRARCLLCPWLSRWNLGPVFAGWDGMKHARQSHPEAEGIIILIEKKELRT